MFLFLTLRESLSFIESLKQVGLSTAIKYGAFVGLSASLALEINDAPSQVVDVVVLVQTGVVWIFRVLLQSKFELKVGLRCLHKQVTKSSHFEMICTTKRQQPFWTGFEIKWFCIALCIGLWLLRILQNHQPSHRSLFTKFTFCHTNKPACITGCCTITPESVNISFSRCLKSFHKNIIQEYRFHSIYWRFKHKYPKKSSPGNLRIKIKANFKSS